jgi:hypothetical protein
LTVGGGGGGGKVGEEGRGDAALAPPPPPPRRMEEEAEAEEEEEKEDVGAAARGFREAWETLLGQAVVAGAWPAEGQEPLAVRAVVGAVAPLLERAERQQDEQEQAVAAASASVVVEEGREALSGTVADLEWAHKVVAAGMGALSDRVRGAVGRRWREVEGLQGECWAVVAATPLARDPQLVAMVAARRPGWEGVALEGLLALAGRGRGKGVVEVVEVEEEKEAMDKMAEAEKEGEGEGRGETTAAASGLVEGKEDGDGEGLQPDAEGETETRTTVAAATTTTTTTIDDAAPDDDAAAAAAAALAAASASAAAAAERLRPLVGKLANARSLLEAGRAQAEDAAKAAWVQWGRLRHGLLAAARRGAGLGGVGGGGRTLLLYDARCAHHRVPEAHVEQPGRFLEASGAMRALAREYPGRYLLRTQIGDAYFPRACGVIVCVGLVVVVCGCVFDCVGVWLCLCVWMVMMRRRRRRRKRDRRTPPVTQPDQIQPTHHQNPPTHPQTTTVWRGAAEGYAPEVLRAHTVSHLDALRLRCQRAGSTVTRISADIMPLTAPLKPSPFSITTHAPAPAPAATRPQRRSSSTALGSLALSASASASAAAASLPSPGHHYHGHGRGDAFGGGGGGGGWGGVGGGEGGVVVDGDTFGTRASFIAASVGFAGALQAVDEVCVCVCVCCTTHSCGV